MKEFSKITVERDGVCTLMRCDMCGKEAEFPENGAFEWGGAGSSSSYLRSSYTIDGDYEVTEIDLCYQCAEKLIEYAERYKWNPTLTQEEE